MCFLVFVSINFITSTCSATGIVEVITCTLNAEDRRHGRLNVRLFFWLLCLFLGTYEVRIGFLVLVGGRLGTEDSVR